jgi:hypothetical protein
MQIRAEYSYESPRGNGFVAGKTAGTGINLYLGES